MYEIVNMSWDDVRNLDTVLKSNSAHFVVDVKGSEVQSSFNKDSDIVIFFNMFTKMPYLLLEHIPYIIKEEEMKDIVVPGFKVNISFGEDSTEIILVKESLYESLKEDCS